VIGEPPFEPLKPHAIEIEASVVEVWYTGLGAPGVDAVVVGAEGTDSALQPTTEQSFNFTL
jgi:hypothetical protein